MWVRIVVSRLWRAWAVVRRVMLLTGVVCVAALGTGGEQTPVLNGWIPCLHDPNKSLSCVSLDTFAHLQTSAYLSLPWGVWWWLSALCLLSPLELCFPSTSDSHVCQKKKDHQPTPAFLTPTPPWHRNYLERKVKLFHPLPLTSFYSLHFFFFFFLKAHIVFFLNSKLIPFHTSFLWISERSFSMLQMVSDILGCRLLGSPICGFFSYTSFILLRASLKQQQAWLDGCSTPPLCSFVQFWIGNLQVLHLQSMFLFFLVLLPLIHLFLQFFVEFVYPLLQPLSPLLGG